MSGDVLHWHVTLTLAGEPVHLPFVRAAVQRLAEQQPFLGSVKVTEDTAEIQFWDEGPTMLDVASLALRFWGEYRESANLPNWQVAGLEIVRKDIDAARSGQGHPVQGSPSLLAPSAIR